MSRSEHDDGEAKPPDGHTVFQIPNAAGMSPVHHRPKSREFSLRNYRVSPLIESYLKGEFEPPPRGGELSSLEDPSLIGKGAIVDRRR